jgi:transposase
VTSTGRTRRRLAQIEARLGTLKAELKQAVQARGSQLMDIYGIGPAGAARILADVGEVARFPDRNHFAYRGRHRPDRRLVR